LVPPDTIFLQKLVFDPMHAGVKHVVAIAAILVLTAALVATVSAAKRHPRLTVVGESPLVVRGSGFLPRERVTLRATAGDQQVAKTVRSTPTGAFSARFEAIPNASCSPFTVTATGARGTTAATRRPRIPEACGIVIQP
jgi:hypothetical protein